MSIIFSSSILCYRGRGIFIRYTLSWGGRRRHHVFPKKMLHETIREECIEFKQQLEYQRRELETQRATAETQQIETREAALIEQFPANVQCVYYGSVDNKSTTGETLIKFGNSNYLRDRVVRHKNTYSNFHLINAFRVENCQHVENAIKNHPAISHMRRRIKIHETAYTELLALNGMSYDALNTLWKEIIQLIEYSPENYRRLLNENDTLKKSLHILHNKLERHESQSTQRRELADETHIIPSEPQSEPEQPCTDINIESSDPDPSSTTTIKTFQKVRPYNKRNGKYLIDGVVYDKLFGTRQEVWDSQAYKTSGELVKSDLMISDSVHSFGKIVSRTKHLQEKSLSYNRFEAKKRQEK